MFMYCNILCVIFCLPAEAGGGSWGGGDLSIRGFAPTLPFVSICFYFGEERSFSDIRSREGPIVRVSLPIEHLFLVRSI